MNKILPQGGSIYWWFYSAVIAEILVTVWDVNTYFLLAHPQITCMLIVCIVGVSPKEIPFSRHINDLSFSVKVG